MVLIMWGWLGYRFGMVGVSVWDGCGIVLGWSGIVLEWFGESFER